MKTEKSNTVKFYTEYKDLNNKIHYTVSQFNQSDKTVTSFRDFKFKD